MDHYVMIAVLRCVGALGRAKSTDVAKRLGLTVKYVSLVLKRCKSRGYVDRESYKRGREHGYVNWLTERGKDWLKKKAESKKIETAGLSKTSRSDLKSSKCSKWASWFLILKNEELRRENQESSISVGMTSRAYRKCSSERDFIGRQFLSLKSQLECREKELQYVAKLLKQKDKMILDLMQHIIESERRSKLPERGSPRKPPKQVNFKPFPVITKPPIQQPPKAKESILELLIQHAAKEVALRYRLSLMDQWWDILPEPKGVSMDDIFCSVTKAYCDELKGGKGQRKISRPNRGGRLVPNGIPRLPY